MKALFIGGTGVISTAVGALALARGWELTLLNRGTNAARAPRGARVLTADIHDEAAVKAALGDERFDVAVDFIAFTEEDVQRDVRLFAGRAAQYIFISSASAYQKPVAALPITESTPLANPYWQYSRDKIACENFLMERYREEGFPVTIVRPSHTYCGGKAANVRFDNTKIKRLVPDFAPRVSMAQGIRGAVEYLLAHPELQTPDPEFDTWCDRVLAAQSAAKAVFDGAHLT